MVVFCARSWRQRPGAFVSAGSHCCEGGLSMSNAGRPALPGPREPNGRLSRRGVDRDPIVSFNSARALWRSFAEARRRCEAPTTMAAVMAQVEIDRQRMHHVVPDHPLLHLVRLDKLTSGHFCGAVYWAATTTPNLDWPMRDWLREVTGFNFRSRAGCEAARRAATKSLGTDAVTTLDRVAAGSVDIDIGEVSELLDAVWRTWCKHGARRRAN